MMSRPTIRSNRKDSDCVRFYTAPARVVCWISSKGCHNGFSSSDFFSTERLTQRQHWTNQSLFWTGWKLREVIRDCKPWRFALDVNMEFRSNPGVVIKSSERQAIIRSASELRDDRRTANAAKPSKIAPRGFVEDHKVLALNPLELRHSCAGATSERCPLRFPTH